jgi:site-specific DNA recombinase
MMGGMRSAGVYVRISSDPSGRALGVQRQRQDGQDLVRRMGWNLAQVYEDNDVSATRGDRRPAYERLLADMDSGRITAVVVWALDRLHRRPAELEQFIDLANRRDVALASVSGEHDLATSEGRGHARMLGVFGAMESEKISDRVRRKQKQLRDEGKPAGGGHRPYGYDKTRMKVVKREAAVLREIAERLIAGASIRSIADDLNRRGVKPARADAWTTTTVKAVISKPRIAGLLTYRGEVLGEGAWPPILDQETFRLVQVALDRRRPTRVVTNARKHLLSGLVVCGVDGCGLPMQIAHQSAGVLGYKCPLAHVTRNQALLDAHVVAEVIAYAADHPVRVTSWQDPAQAALADQVAVLEARKADAADQFADGSIPADVLRRVIARIQSDLDALKAQQGTSAAVAFDTTRWVAFDLSDGWAGLSLHEKRAALLMYAERIAVHPAKARGRGFDPSSIEMRFRDPERMTFRGIVES